MSWWLVFHVVLIAPLGAMLLAALYAAIRETDSTRPQDLTARLRLQRLNTTGFLWAGALVGFMYGGNWIDLTALLLAVAALRREGSRNLWIYTGILIAFVVKRNAGIFRTALQSVVWFEPTPFYRDFFSHFGPADFMGVPLPGAWWLPAYYAVIILAFNIGGEELWWRGYVLPRQEISFPRSAWLIHGVMWSAFHAFMQPTLWDTTRMAITGTALAYVVHRTRNTWTGIVGHTAGNLPFFLNLVHGVSTP
jgi:membrane protease YdiL (CAAX protease family)